MRIYLRSVAAFGLTLVAASAYVVGFAAGIVVKIAEHVGRAQDDAEVLREYHTASCALTEIAAEERAEFEQFDIDEWELELLSWGEPS